MDSSYYCCSSKDQTKFWLQVGQVFHSSCTWDLCSVAKFYFYPFSLAVLNHKR